MKKNKLLIGGLAAFMAVSMCLAVPAFAEEGAQTDMAAATEATQNVYTSEDGVLSIALPDASWKEIQDPTKWIALSNGSDLITLEHFSNGEKLPDIVVADSHYVNTLMATFSTQNEVFAATGFVTNPANMNAINESMLSIKILKYDTKLAVNKNQDVYEIAPANMTMYVNVGAAKLNVRSSYSVDSSALGELPNGVPVQVTGIVKRNGQDFGWYQIVFNNATGYVSGEYLSANAPAATPTPTPTPAPTDNGESSLVPPADAPVETYLVYSQGSGRPVNITGSSGVFYDGFGNVYYAIGGAGGGNFVDAAGAYYTTTMPASAPDTEVIGLVSDGSGRPVSIMENEDGSYTDEEGNEYYEDEDGGYYDDYGATYEVSGTNEEM